MCSEEIVCGLLATFMTYSGRLQAEGVKSKRDMKAMLQDLKKRGWVSTRPPPAESARKDRAYRYLLSKKVKSESPSTVSEEA